MGTYDRSRHFETLMALRLGYASAATDDRRSTISIDDMITYAEAVMSALAAEDALVAREAEAASEAGEKITSTLDPRD